MKKKAIKPKRNIAQELVDDATHQILQSLHIKLPIKNLVIIRDRVISQRKNYWDKESYLGKALKFHYEKANLGQFENINYLHLLMAELIRNFSIATKEEYLIKCEEFRIYPFQDKISSKKNLKQSNMTIENVIDSMRKSFEQNNEEGIKEKKDEIKNAMNQDYPICSFEDLLGKINLN